MTWYGRWRRSLEEVENYFFGNLPIDDNLKIALCTPFWAPADFSGAAAPFLLLL